MFFKWYDPILEFFYKMIISLVSAFYNLIGYLYQIFNVLIRTRIFTSDDYLGILNKVYLVLGIVVLFVIAYNFLLLVIDPDKNKGGKVVEKFLKDLVISLALMSFVPTIFDFAFDFEASIITEKSIQKIFASESNPISSDSLIVGGRQMAMGVFDSFFYQIDPNTGERKYQQKDEDTPASSNNNAGVSIGTALGEVKQEVTESGKFGKFRAYAKNIVDDEVNFDWLLALIAGGYFVYIMLNYCFDMAVRVMKLAFFQIVAPIAIACRMIPSKEGVFKNWYSKTLKTYTSSFIRIFILSMTVYIFQILGKNLESSNFWGSDVDMSFGVKGFAYALLILGIVTFIKQVPQLIDELFGLNADIKLGLRDKVAAGGGFAAGALAGGAITAGFRNLTHAGGKIRSDLKGFTKKSGGERLKSIGRVVGHGIGGVFSTAGGAIFGGAHGLWYGKNAKSEKDMFQFAEKGAKKATDDRDRREAYIASHSSWKHGGVPGAFVSDFTIRPLGNAAKAAGRWAGIGNTDSLQGRMSVVSGAQGFISDIKSTVGKVADDFIEHNEGGGTFEFGSHTTQEMYDLKMEYEAARNSGNKAALQTAKDKYDQAYKEFCDGLLEYAYYGEKEWMDLSTGSDQDKKVFGELSKAHLSKNKLDALARDNANTRLFEKTGLGEGKTVKVKDIKDLKDKLVKEAYTVQDELNKKKNKEEKK